MSSQNYEGQLVVVFPPLSLHIELFFQRKSVTRREGPQFIVLHP